MNKTLCHAYRVGCTAVAEIIPRTVRFISASEVDPSPAQALSLFVPEGFEPVARREHPTGDRYVGPVAPQPYQPTQQNGRGAVSF